MAKHRKTSFRIEKFIKSAKDDLVRQYLEERKVSVPQGLKFDGGDAFDKFWETIDEVRKKNLEEELYLVDDIAESTRDYVQEALEDFEIQHDEDDNGETLALRIFLHEDKDAFQQVYDKYSCVTYLKSVSKCKFKSGKADLSDKKLNEFIDDIKGHYGSDGKGKHCTGKVI